MTNGEDIPEAPTRTIMDAGTEAGMTGGGRLRVWPGGPRPPYRAAQSMPRSRMVFICGTWNSEAT
ncbi:hypothetical protein GGQ63_003366 [Prosthecomicrobium pneumaticum]|uniref:Uncharacterized protein n=1 Tax=Prosthecomicrobium pneumaticum TaxID=81895 RepID=A0A7W9FP41_9HYPH|nr:hypothetical protein [Prosthecomicrobium pneumaticum]